MTLTTQQRQALLAAAILIVAATAIYFGPGHRARRQMVDYDACQVLVPLPPGILDRLRQAPRFEACLRSRGWAAFEASRETMNDAQEIKEDARSWW